MHEIRLPRERRGFRTFNNYYKGVSFYSKIEHKADEVMKKVGGGYLPYVECENCGHHITLKGWRDNICPNCRNTVKR